ncbi:MAG: cohesin domain-containing protein [Oscillospiraceae bacterium]|nr:cohesin domain-containing protein [Oscillospiraceae bacterium]
MEPIHITDGAVLSDPLHATMQGAVKLTYDMSLEPENITANGIVATLTFEIKRTAELGDTEITVDYNPNEIYDVDYNNVFFKTIAGKVVIQEAPPPPTPVITLGVASGRPEATVDIPLSIANNSGIIAFNVNIGFDRAKLKLVGVTNGEVFNDPVFSGTYETYPFRLCYDMATSPDNVTKNGIVATLSFEILPSVQAGDVEISIDYDPEEIFDVKYNNIHFDKINGKIVVTESDPSHTCADSACRACLETLIQENFNLPDISKVLYSQPFSIDVALDSDVTYNDGSFTITRSVPEELRGDYVYAIIGVTPMEPSGFYFEQVGAKGSIVKEIENNVSFTIAYSGVYILIAIPSFGIIPSTGINDITYPLVFFLGFAGISLGVCIYLIRCRFAKTTVKTK